MENIGIIRNNTCRVVSYIARTLINILKGKVTEQMVYRMPESTMKEDKWMQEIQARSWLLLSRERYWVSHTNVSKIMCSSDADKIILAQVVQNIMPFSTFCTFSFHKNNEDLAADM